MNLFENGDYIGLSIQSRNLEKMFQTTTVCYKVMIIKSQLIIIYHPTVEKKLSSLSAKVET